MSGSIHIGTAGWSIRSEQRAAFPEEGSHLERYARVLNGVEINTTFYRSHRPSTFERWSESTPEGFRFAVKMPRTITHERRLRESGDLLATFTAEIAHLGRKLGPVLIQLPPSLSFAPEIALPFLETARRLIVSPIVLEPRHPSWFSEEVASHLIDRSIARVVADPPPHPEAAYPAGDSSILYLRLHGSPRIYYSNYEEEFLEGVVQLIGDSFEGGAHVWCIFDNTAEGHALDNALEVARRLGLAPGAQRIPPPQPNGS